MTILARPNVKHNTRFVPPVSDLTLGRRMYAAGARLTACVTDEQAQGWLQAEEAGYQAYVAEMHSERLSFDFDVIALRGERR